MKLGDLRKGLESFPDDTEIRFGIRETSYLNPEAPSISLRDYPTEGNSFYDGRMLIIYAIKDYKKQEDWNKFKVD